MKPNTMRTNVFLGLFAVIFVSGLFLFSAGPAEAAITEAGTPIMGLPWNANAGPGSIMPIAKFMLQGDGSTTLTKVGFILRASSTMDTLTQISGIALYRENGTTTDFQYSSDYYVPGTYTANPATSTLVIMQPTGGYLVPSVSTEFYIVASTSAIANIINNNAFDIQFQTNYSSTSAGTGIGTAYNAEYKVTLEKTLNVRISEVRAGSTGSDLDEFIELYNRAPFAIDIQTAGIALHTFSATGGATSTALSYARGKTIVPEHGYFLIANSIGYSDSGTVPADATYATTTNLLIAHGGFSIATSSAVANATSTAIDRIGWGNQPTANCEGGACAAALAEAGSTLERKAESGSTASSMASGGADVNKGNGNDTNNNTNDFVAQATAVPQNTASPVEFPFGGGYNDTVGPFVNSSFPMDNATGVTIDRTYIGFNFNEPVSGGTIVSTTATTTVTLVPQGTAPAQVASANLCTSVTVDTSMNYKCMLSANLLPSATYVFEVGTSTASAVRDVQGNAFDQNSFTAGVQSYKSTFTTGSSGQTMTNITPPQIIGGVPFNGNYNIPTNIAKFFVKFSQPMLSTTLNSTNIKLYSIDMATRVRTEVSWGSATFSLDTASTTLTITSLPTLSANTSYDIALDGLDSSGDTTGVTSMQNVLLSMPEFVIFFTTGSGTDSTAPQVLGVMPSLAGASGIALNTVAFTVMFDDHIDISTATSGAVSLAISGGATVPVSFSYNPGPKEALVVSQNLLPAGQTMVLTIKGGSIRNVSNTQMGTNYTMTFGTEATNSDSTGPSIVFANADVFGLAVTFNEAVNSSDATTLGNYSLTVGGTTVNISALAGHTASYEAGKRTATISGLQLTSGASFTIIASSIRDISGNMTASASMSGSVMTMAASGGFLDPGMAGGGAMSGPPPSTSFTTGSGGTGFMPPANIMVMNNFVSASSTYGFEIPISTQIPADGQIVVTFPSNSDYSVCCAATSSTAMLMLNDNNRDINGPGAGTIGIKTVTRDNTAKTVILTIDTATRSESSDTHDFLRFGLTDIKNPSVSKGPDSSGYAIDIKTKNASGVILESSFNVNPVFIGGGNFGGIATTTVRGQVLSAYDSTTGLNGVSVMLHSPILGPMPRSADTASSGNFSFTDLPINNDYYIFTAPNVSPTTVTGGGATTTGYFGSSEPSPMRATSSSFITRNLTLTATTSAVSLTIKLTAVVNTFSATEKVDIFAGGSGQFVVQTVTPGAGVLSATTLTTLSLPQQNGMWFVSIGPAMPKDGMMMGGPPPSPAWQMPKPLELSMSGCPSACSLTESGIPKSTHTFTINKADKNIYGLVKDASGTVISNAMIFAYSPSQMMGTNGQSDSVGKFSLSVVQGVYNVGAFFPGMGNSSEVSVEVVSGTGANTVYYVAGSKTASTGQSGANPFIITIKRPSYTITGRVTDGTNAVTNTPVFAYRTNGPGNADAMTDTSGNYTLYVDNGTWQVSCHIPGYGRMTEQTVTIASVNQSSIDFAPSGSTTYWSVLGTVFESADANIGAAEGVANVMVQAKRLDTGAIFEAKTGTDGAYNLRVPQLATTTSQYRLEAFKPGFGKIPVVNESLAAIPNFGIVATTTWNIRINTRQIVTVNVKDSSGNFLSVPEAYIDLFDITNNYGNSGRIINGTSTTIQVPNGASTTIRVFIPSAPPSAVSVASDSGSTLVLSGVLEVNGAETIKVVISTSLRTISGVVYHTAASAGNELKDVWVEVVDATNGTHYGVSATSTAGTYSIQLADGTSYNIVAVKPGYMMAPQALTVSANATLNLVMTSANLTISGTITAGGAAAPSAFVWAEKVGGGFTGTQAAADGTYSLSVDSGTYRIFAASDKYSRAGYSGNPLIVSSSQTGINISPSTSASVRDELFTSNTFKDTASGSFEDTTLNTKVTVDGGALGQSGSDSYITAKETANYPETPDVNVIGDKAKEISAYSGGSQVKNLSSGKTATVELTYLKTELATEGIDTPTEVGRLKIGTTNEQNQWELLGTIATYKDVNGNAVAVASGATSIPTDVTQITFTTTEASHFSTFALDDPWGSTPPNTPTGLAVTADTSSRLIVTWTANTENDISGYYLYHDTASNGSFPLLTTLTSNTYTHTGLNAASVHYYRVSAYDTGGDESAACTAVSGTTKSGYVGGGGGGGGGEAVTPTPAPTVAPTPTTVAPTVTPVAGLSLGDLIKASDHPAVYYYGSDGKRYVFPNEKTYKSWYTDFSSVKTITKAELASISIGQNVTYKPGARLVKFMTDPKTYAVAKNGILRWIKTEALAKALYGDSWNKLIDDINEAFFANYTIGLAIEKASDYDKSTELTTATDISADKGKTSAPTKLAAVAAKLKVISDWLNMRSGPSTAYKVLVQLQLGDLLEKLDVSGKWIKVKTAVGKIGWVHLSYVQ